MSRGKSPKGIDIPMDATNSHESTDVNDVDHSQAGNDAFWLQLAESNYTAARDYQNSALTTQWERNADHFNSRHYRRSAYTTQLYRGRSRLFRPLSRASERSSSSQAAMSLFSNVDLLDVVPRNQNDPAQVLAARVAKNIMHYHLEETIEWYLTVMGAFQDTRVYGPCVTYTGWEFKEEISEVNGEMKLITVEDKPYINMIPVENLLLDPACDWRDPIQSSTYLVYLEPTAVGDIEAKMEELPEDKTGQTEWIHYTRAQILATDTDDYNIVEQAREGDNRPNKFDSQREDEFAIRWVHVNYVRLDGKEYIYRTLGSTLMLTEPKLLNEEVPVGRRPFTYGFSIIEAHKFAPSSATELIAGLQFTVNDIANLRIDNVRLALNKRFFIRRGATVDLEELMRSVPGGGVFTDNPEKDVKVIETRDVTSSSYQEQERLETESNDLTGTFLGSSVQNNRALNETVGGMEMLAAGHDAVSEFDITTFAQTFVKKQLTLLWSFIQAYERDDVILSAAFDSAAKELPDLIPNFDDEKLEGTPAEFRNSVLSNVLDKNMSIRVNIGLGATSPQRKMNSFNTTVGSIASNETQAAKVNWDEVTKEQFAMAGFQDGGRFLLSESAEEITEENVNEAYEKGVEEGSDKHKTEQIESNERIKTLDREAEDRRHIQTLASKENITEAEMGAKLDIEFMRSADRRDDSAGKLASKRNELNFKAKTGRDGI